MPTEVVVFMISGLSVLKARICILLMTNIRHPYADPDPPGYFEDYLNLPEVQNAIGVNLNYTKANNDIYWAFQETGDFIYPNFIEDLEMLLDAGVRVSLYYGDADYICNWFGGQ